MTPHSHAVVTHPDAVTKYHGAAEPVGNHHDDHGRGGEDQAVGDDAGPAIGGMDEAVDDGEDQRDPAAERMRPGRPWRANLRAAQEIHRAGQGAEGPGEDGSEESSEGKEE